MIKQLRQKFIRIAMLAVTAVLILLCAIINTANYISVDSELTQMLEVINQNQGTLPFAPHMHKPDRRPDGQFTMETPYSTRFFVLRYTDDGTLIQAELDKIAAITPEDTSKYLDIAIKHGEGYGYTSGYKYYVTSNGDNRRMAIFLDCYKEMRSVSMIAVLSFAAAAVCIVIVYITVVLFSRKAVDPVVRSTQRQKQFITDAGHELKTPITVIATSLKVLEMETGKNKWIDKSQAQTEKLKDLVNSLVTLSKMDEEDSPLKFDHFNISAAVLETAESFTDFAASKGHSLELAVSPDIEFYGDEYSVRQLVSILLDNAIKYADDDTAIYLALDKSKKGVTIRTANECETAQNIEFDKLFDRFYRANKSRTSGGFGIGLSIARSIAEGHKGSVRAKCENGHTVEITAELK